MWAGTATTTFPPHIHVEYQGAEALVAIETGDMIDGRLGTKAARLIEERCLDHQGELRGNWQRSVALRPLQRIPEADND